MLIKLLLVLILSLLITIFLLFVVISDNPIDFTLDLLKAGAIAVIGFIAIKVLLAVVNNGS